jgi:alanine racemase
MIPHKDQLMSLRHTINTQLQRLEREFVTFNRIEVSRSAWLHNYELYQKLSPGAVFPVLKANAYGHGLSIIADIVRDMRPPYLAVDGYFEALALRNALPRQPILVMGAIKPQNFTHMNLRGFAFVVHDVAVIRALGATKKPVRIHLELETGMARHGVAAADLGDILRLIKTWPNLTLEGVMSHLADADNPDPAYTDLQTKRFDDGVDQVLAAGFKPTWFHLAQSAGTPKVQSRHANAVRPGIGLCGINPLESEDPAHARLADLRPVLSLISGIAKTIDVPKGESVGYGCTFVAQRDSRIGVLPLGYYEGVRRALSNRGIMTVGDTEVPIAGRVCMNHTMIDLTDTAAEVGDEVVIINSDGTAPNSLIRQCARADLFHYEVLANLSPTIRRCVVD